jgi:hypothetical protein
MENFMTAEQIYSEDLSVRVAIATMEGARMIRRLAFRQRYLECLCDMERAGITITISVFLAVVDYLATTAEEKSIAAEYRMQLLGAPVTLREYFSIVIHKLRQLHKRVH